MTTYAEARRELPVGVLLDELAATLEAGDAVLEAPPGAGKTTLVPLALRDAPWLDGRRIVMLEPRRLAARAAAERMAELLGEPVGRSVGYRVRLDSRFSAATRVEVVTEGILTRMLQDDPSLDGVGLVILDEFHERSLEADLGLALALHGRALFRDADPLRLLPMSATLDGDAVAALLGGVPVLRCEGRRFPVAVRYGEPRRPGDDVAARTAAAVRRALAEEQGSVLVFLPGRREIDAVAERLADLASPTVHLLPLYGDLDLAAQHRVIEPPPEGNRKVVLATAIAESSLTIDGIRVVVDAGLARLPAFDPATGMTRLVTRPLSRAASEQRAGRAGRVAPGTCVRLWSESQQAELLPATPPEIVQTDLAPLALQLLRWGVPDPAELAWLDPPPAAAYAQALDLLARLGAAEDRDGAWRLTDHGAAMAALPAHPRLAHLLLRGRALGLAGLACDLAALLTERDPHRGPEADVALRLARLARPGRDGALRQLRRLADRFRSRLGIPATEETADSDPDAPGLLLACAYPERIARRRGPGPAYRLANGRGATLDEADPLRGAEWLAIAHLGGHAGRASDRIRLAAMLDPARFDAELADLAEDVERAGWDDAGERLVAVAERRVGALTLASRPLDAPPAGAFRAALLDRVRRDGLVRLDWPETARQLRARVSLLRRLDLEAEGTSDWPDLGDAALLDDLDAWLGPALDGVRTLAALRDLDTTALLRALLPWPLPRELDRLAPERVEVPSGSKLRVDYATDPPVLAVKLQEMFGCRETPRVADGRVALVVHLLSPAGRPLQVTGDLASFWVNGYADVRKEMRGRYPKHPWPEDPLEAAPTARAKPRPRR